VALAPREVRPNSSSAVNTAVGCTAAISRIYRLARVGVIVCHWSRSRPVFGTRGRSPPLGLASRRYGIVDETGAAIDAVFAVRSIAATGLPVKSLTVMTFGRGRQSGEWP
jgi:hypothetical protein